MSGLAALLVLAIAGSIGWRIVKLGFRVGLWLITRFIGAVVLLGLIAAIGGHC